MPLWKSAKRFLSPSLFMATDLLTTPAVAGDYDFVQCAPGEALDTIVGRFTVKASEVNRLVRERDPTGLTHDAFLNVFADTFGLDEQFATSPFITIVARVIDVHPILTSHTSFPVLVMPINTSLHALAVQLLTQEVRGGWLHITSAGTEELAVPYELTKPHTPLVVVWSASGRNATLESSAAPERIWEVAHNPYVWSLLKAQFAAACEWVEEPATKAAGVDVLRWVGQCTRALASATGPLAAEACQLNYQAAALLLLASGTGGAHYVPVWSAEYLKGRIDQLLGVLHGYELKIQGLEIKHDVQGTVEALSKALRDVAGADEKSLATAADLNQQEIDATWEQYYKLIWAYELQEHSVRLAYYGFKRGIDEAATLRTLGAVMEIVGAAAQIAGLYFGVAVPDPKVGGQVLSEAQQKSAQLAKEAQGISGKISNAVQATYLAYTVNLTKTMEKLGKYAKLAAEAGVAAAKIRKANQLESSSSIQLPDLSGVAALDPVLDWNLFITQAELTLRSSINGTGEKEPPIAGAKEYYMSLYALSEYGKALSTKAVVLTRLQGRALELEAQRNASRFAVQRWEQLHLKAQSAEEKLSLGRSLLLEASLNTKRSLLVMAEGYRAAYYYNNLTEPAMRLRLSMDYNALNEEFRSIKTDITSFFAQPRITQRLDTDYFTLPIVRAGAMPPPQAHAVLTQPTSGKPVLSWSMPLQEPPFQQWLGSSKKAVYFVEEAWFELEGAKPNPTGIIRLEVATSGTYENGYGGAPTTEAPAGTRFISQGLALDYGYALGKSGEPFVRWQPIELSHDNYMRPSPFTTWLATIEQAGDLSQLHTLRIKLALRYRNLS
jgi:hypothetical protein